MPQGNTNKYAVYPIPISDISSFTITSLLNSQFIYYNDSQWINQNISGSNVSILTSDLLSCEKQATKIQLMVIVYSIKKLKYQIQIYLNYHFQNYQIYLILFLLLIIKYYIIIIM